MSKKLSVGDKVMCQYYNTPEEKFYGDLWEAEIVAIEKTNFEGGKEFLVHKSEQDYDLFVERREIKKVL